MLDPFAGNAAAVAVAQNIGAGQIPHFGRTDSGIQSGNFFRFSQTWNGVEAQVGLCFFIFQCSHIAKVVP